MKREGRLEWVGVCVGLRLRGSGSEPALSQVEGTRTGRAKARQASVENLNYRTNTAASLGLDGSETRPYMGCGYKKC